MYNFLDSKLSPKVHSSAATLDNYEVTNLISEDFATRSRGFVAYTTVKPPVDLTFELICPVNIHYIILWTTLGTQKCTSLEIFAKNGNYNNREFRSIAFAKFNADGLIVCNYSIYSINKPPENIDRSFRLSFFKNTAFRAFTTASIIKVRILQTERTVPCLGKVEIWGKPSKICSLVTINTINSLMRKPQSTTMVSTDKNNDLKSKDAVEEWRIPEEFKDALTYEVMAIPFTLPSGNTIDQSTLEKYIQNEASYGRAASDPFTSQRFTDTRKPVFNAALKNRIDMFLLENSSQVETFTVKRTLGSNNKISIRDGESSNREIKKIKFSDRTRYVNYDDLDEKLNEAINKTMNSNGFMNFTSEEVNNACNLKNCNECIKCKEIINLYVIPCKHLYCRNCLLEICKNLKCGKCESSFNKGDPKRFHL